MAFQLDLNVTELDYEAPDDDESVVDWDCDWEDELCLWCGQALDRHSNASLTRCARMTV